MLLGPQFGYGGVGNDSGHGCSLECKPFCGWKWPETFREAYDVEMQMIIGVVGKYFSEFQNSKGEQQKKKLYSL